MPTPQPAQAFDALSAHEDRLVRLEDALIESARQTADLSGSMKSFEHKLEGFMITLGSDLRAVSQKISATEAALATTSRRLEALEARKEAADKSKARWRDNAEKVGLYVLTGTLGAIGGWLIRLFATRGGPG